MSLNRVVAFVIRASMRNGTTLSDGKVSHEPQLIHKMQKCADCPEMIRSGKQRKRCPACSDKHRLELNNKYRKNRYHHKRSL